VIYLSIVVQSTDTFSFYLQFTAVYFILQLFISLSIRISHYCNFSRTLSRSASRTCLKWTSKHDGGEKLNCIWHTLFPTKGTAFGTACAALCALLLYVLPCPVVCSGFHFPCTSPIPLHSDMSSRPHRTTQRLATTSKLQRVQSVRQSADSSLLAFLRVHKTSQTVVNRSFLESLRRGAWRPQWL
jgi:hypothetical protein